MNNQEIGRMKTRSMRTRAGAIVGAVSRFAIYAGAGLGASALGAPFEVNRVDAGGVPVLSVGNPITWSPANAAFNPASGSDRPPTAGAVYGSPVLLYDSYGAIDSHAATYIESCSSTCCDGYSAMGTTSLTTPEGASSLFRPGSMSGLWFNDPLGANGGFVSSVHIEVCGNNPPAHEGPPFSQWLLIAQITLRPGTSAPTTNGLAVNIRDAGTANPLGETGLLKFGIENATNNGGLWGQAYYLEMLSWNVVSGLTGSSSVFNGGRSYEIYVAAVPPPCPGDLNDDRLRTTADLIIFLGQFGRSGDLSGDLNDDNLVNSADLVILLAGYGQWCP